MSDRTGSASFSKTVVRKGVVKDLITEFEQLRVCKTESIGMLRMGADQSSLSKTQGNPRPATISLVKQRVSQFDFKTESENQIDKKRRHKSIADNNKGQVNVTKDFQRSKSYDYVRKEKDRYSRVRQEFPKTNEDIFKFETTTPEGNPTDNSTNNNLRKRNHRRKPVQETTVESSSGETRKDNKTSPKSPQQFEVPKIATREQNKEDVPKSDTSRIENTNEAVSSANRRPIRSVKSIKKIFEGSERKSSPKTIKKESTVSLNTITDDEDNQNKFSSNKHIATDNGGSEDLADKKISKKVDLERFVQDKGCDRNNSDEFKTLEHLHKNNLNGVAEALNKNSSDADFTYNCSEDEFNNIENKFQELEQTIKEMKKNRSNNDLAADDELQTEPNDQYSNEDMEEPENINVYMEKYSTGDEMEDEFGKRSFVDSEPIEFTEAYNIVGDELIITSVAAVEHRSLSESFPSQESLVLDNCSDAAASSVNELEEENSAILEGTSTADELDNAVENKLYFSTEELQDTESEIASNRSTFYLSTTTNSSESLERYSKAESDEGVEVEKETEHIYEEIRLENNVEIRSNSASGYDRTIKTETIYDSFKNPRIAKVSNVNSEECATKAESPVVEEAEPLEALKSPGLKPKKDYLIEELIDTEKTYIKHLEKVVWDYMPAITDEKLPPSLIGKSRFLFGNIKRIYNTTQTFYRALKSCGNDHEEIAKTFISFKNLFELYPLYSKNKPRADQYLLGDFKDVVSAREKQLNDRLGLASNLLTPIQRLGKYILFLQQIQKELSKSGFPSDNVYKATQVVRKQMSRGNDYIAIDSIKDCPFSLLEQGSFVMREKFNVIKPRKYEAMVFLFEEMLVLTTVDSKNQEVFIYKDGIKLNEMGIVTFDDQPLVFHLKRFPSYKKGPKELNEFVIEAKKSKDKKTWTEQIEKRLWEQLVKCKEKQKEMHSNQGKSPLVMELPDRIRRKKPGYSSLPSEMRKNPPKSVFYYKMIRDA